MARVRLTADVDPELRRQVKIAAASVDKSVSEWIEDVLRHELLDYQDGRKAIYIGDAKVTMPPPGVKPQGSKNPPRLRDGSKVSDAVLKDREERDRLRSGATIVDRGEPDLSWYREDMATMPPPGARPKGTENPPKLRDGSLISNAVIEDRR